MENKTLVQDKTETHPENESSNGATNTNEESSIEELIKERDALDEKFRAELEAAYERKRTLQDLLPSSTSDKLFTEALSQIIRMKNPPQVVVKTVQICLGLVFPEEELKKKGEADWKVLQELLRSKEKILKAPETVDETKVKRFESFIEDVGVTNVMGASMAAYRFLAWGGQVVSSYRFYKNLPPEMKQWLDKLEIIYKVQPYEPKSDTPTKPKTSEMEEEKKENDIHPEKESSTGSNGVTNTIQENSIEELIKERDALDEQFKAKLDAAFQKKRAIQDCLPSSTRDKLFTEKISEIARMANPPSAVVITAQACLKLLFNKEELKKKGGELDWKTCQELLKSKDLVSRMMKATETVDEDKVKRYEKLLNENPRYAEQATQTVNTKDLFNWCRTVVLSYQFSKDLSPEMKQWLGKLEKINGK
mgnify:CR=1 FL=1